MTFCLRCKAQSYVLDPASGLCVDCMQDTGHEIVDPTAEQALSREALAAIELTSEMVSPFPIEQRLGVITGCCIFGQHLGKDLLAVLRDVIGGRAGKAETVFADARQAAMDDLRRQALDLGATAVIAVQMAHQELAGGGKSMVMVTVTGTAVR